MKKEKKQAIVNLYHFIRKSTYPDGEFVQEDLDTIANEMSLMKKYGLASTYALKYDALMDERYIDLMKTNIDERDEIAAWWEITEELAKKSGVKWRGKAPSSLHVSEGYCLAYLPEERKALIDTYMNDFKEIYGYYPKTIASWIMDIVSFRHAFEKYGVIGGGLCRDQRGVDGFTLWGGYANGAYYPSKVNEFVPAQSKEGQIKMPIFRLLGPDPIYNFESEARTGAEGIYSLEPAWTCGQSKTWVDWHFRCITEEEQLGYGYTQAGQENSFLWPNVEEGFEMQMHKIAELERVGKIRVETLRDSAIWFEKQYELTPAISFSASSDWNKQFDLKTTWYSSRYYRTSFLWDQGCVSIRDLFLFDENYSSRYLTETMVGNESIFDALPILDTCGWSGKENRMSIDFVDKTKGEKLVASDLKFEAMEDELSWKVQWCINKQHRMEVICLEDRMDFFFGKEGLALKLPKIPVLQSIQADRLVCMHQNFSYEMRVEGADLVEEVDGIYLIPKEGRFSLYMDQGKPVEALVFSAEYQPPMREQETIHKPKYLQKPVLSHKHTVKPYGTTVTCIMEHFNTEGEIYFTTDGTEPNIHAQKYEKATEITKDCVIHAMVIDKNGNHSAVVKAEFENAYPIKEISSDTIFDSRKIFNRNGILDIIDGKKGSLNHVDDCWLITPNDIEFIADLGEVKPISTMEMSFLQSKRGGPYYPKMVTIEHSEDGENYQEIFTKQVQADSGDPDNAKETVCCKKTVKARYLRVCITADERGFTFIDQFVVKGDSNEI